MNRFMSSINLPKSNIAPFRKDKPNLFHFFFVANYICINLSLI